MANIVSSNYRLEKRKSFIKQNKIAKIIGVEIIEYKSYMSDLGCRVIYITVSYSKYKFSGDFGYWQNEKSFALSYFKKRLETFKTKIDLKNENT